MRSSLLLSSLVAPSLAAYDVTSFGAVGDGTTDDSSSISKALAAAAASGAPSVVLFPEGKTFLTGPINMSTAMTLQVDGTLRAKSGNNTAGGIAGWPQIPPLPSYGNSRDGTYLQFQAFVYSNGADDIAINGSGTIDGQGDWWWANQRNRSAVPSGRPNLLQFVNAVGVEVSGVTLRDSPFWCLHPVQSRDVHVHHMKIRSRMYAPNSDGVDPDSCRDVMIEHNDISTGDDGIAIKAGVCSDGSGGAGGAGGAGGNYQGGPAPLVCSENAKFSDGTYLTQNVTVRYNTFRIGMGISVGSESSGGIKDVFIHDNVLGLCDAGHCLDTCCGWGPALHLKTALKRGQFLENIVFADNTIYNTTGFIDLETNYQSGDDAPVGYAPTVVKDIVFVGNRALGAGTGASFVCSVKDVCENITVTNNTVAQSADPWHCKFVHTFTVGGNTGEDALDACMKNSMKNPTGAGGEAASARAKPYAQRKQEAVQAWAESRGRQ
jgi:polygalacturonase